MGTVREWLEQNNLEKYAHNFEEEEFDNLDSLKYMTLDHLSTVVKPRGAQAEFLRALEKKFGTATMIHKQLMVTHENKEQKHL